MAGRRTTFHSSTHIPVLELDSVIPEDCVKIENYVRHTNMQHRQFTEQIQFMHRRIEQETNLRLAEIAENTHLKETIKSQAKKIEQLGNVEEHLQGKVKSSKERRMVLREENISLNNQVRDLKNVNEDLNKQLDDMNKNELKGPCTLNDKRKATMNEEDSDDSEDEESNDETLAARKLKKQKTSKEEKSKVSATTEVQKAGNLFTNATPFTPSDCIIS